MSRYLLTVGLLGWASAAEHHRPPACAPAPECAQLSNQLRQHTGAGLRDRDLPLPPGIAGTDDLTEDEAVAIALWNNARFQAALTALGVAKADVIEAGLLRNLGLQILFPVGPKPFESLLQIPADPLWQRPRRLAAARAGLEQVSESLVASGLDLARDVRLACADLALAEARAGITADAAKLRGGIAALTEKRLAAGDISELEALPPRIDARSMADLALRSAQERDLARDRLRLLLGLRRDNSALRLRLAAGPPSTPPEWPALLETALAARADLRAAEIALEAALLRARWERSRIVSLLTPLLSVKGVGQPGIKAGPGLSADLPVFQRNQGGVARTDAEVRRATADYAALRDQVELEIRQARTQFLQAHASLVRVRNEFLPAVRASVRLASKAYEDGEASYLFALETTRQLHDAELREAEETATARRAAAQLERAIGRKW